MTSDGSQPAATGWELVAEHEEIAPLVDAALELEPGRQYARSDLGDAAGVPYKTLYVSEALEALVDVGLLERHDREGDEVAFSVDADAAVYEAAAAVDDALSPRDGRGSD